MHGRHAARPQTARLARAGRVFGPGRGKRPRGLARGAVLAGILAAILSLAGPAPAQDPPGAADRNGRWMHSYMRCIDRTVSPLAARGGDPAGMAETAYGACRHLLVLAEVEAGRRESLEQAAWSYALQTALGRMEGR